MFQTTNQLEPSKSESTMGIEPTNHAKNLSIAQRFGSDGFFGTPPNALFAGKEWPTGPWA